MQAALVSGGAALFVLAAFSHGALGAIKVIPRGLHKAGDIVVAGGLAISPLLVRGDRDIAGVIVAEAVALVLLRFIISTRYSPTAVPVQANVVEARSTEARSTPEAGSTQEAGTRGASVSTARVLGALAAQKARQRDTPEARAKAARRQRMLEEGARRLGTSVGRATRKEPRQ